MKTVLRIVAVLVLLAAAAAGWAGYEAWTFLKTPPATPGQEAFFDVEPGASVRRVADRLEERGLITDARKFLLLARYKKWDSRLQAGRFALNTGWLPEQVLDTLVNGRPVLFRVTVPEGLTWWQTARVLEDAGLVRFEDFRAVITDPAFFAPLRHPLRFGRGLPHAGHLSAQEGRRARQGQARAVAGRMVDNFWRKGDALWPGGKRPSRDELRRLVILASVVEKETAFADERPRVAGVYANRLRINMALQADPTVIYGLGPNFDGNLRRRHLDDANNIYNTYQRPGLPPGPICSFGASALAAAITPEEHKYLYFVAITDGGRHAFFHQPRRS